jgi:DsbC/DsbD-like thiol-disulfide interchange protein
MAFMRIAILATLLAQLIAPAPKPGHATVAAAPAEIDAKPGAKVSLLVEVQPKPGIHVYAPGSGEFYIPITLKLNPQAQLKAGKLVYPKSEPMVFADEKVAVFAKPFRLTQEATLDPSLKPGATVAVAGTVSYQACDDRVCFPPESAPVSWTVTVK